MSFVGSLFSNSQGAGYQAQGANIQDPFNRPEVQQANSTAQNALAQQQAFVNALKAQNGIGNQSNVYNQLQGVANGTGPNPAQAMLSQATGQNTANQAALMAGQRGAGSNVGLIARQAGMQGAANQQNAIGQGATMQANQSLNALGQMGNMATQQVGQQAGALGNYNQLAQNQQNAYLNAIGNLNNANVSMQGGMNSANASIAGLNAQNQANMFGGAMKGLFQSGPGAGGASPSPGGAKGGVAGYDFGGTIGSQQVQVAPAASAGSPSIATISNPYQNMSKSTPSGKPAPTPGSPNPQDDPQGKADGGEITDEPQTAPPSSESQMPSNDNAQPNMQMPATEAAPQASTPQSFAGQYLSQQVAVSPIAAAPAPSIPTVSNPYQSSSSSGGGMSSMMQMLPMLAMAASKGGKVPGQATVGGDDKKNDTVPAMLSPGEIVIPRSIINGKNPVQEGARFIEQQLAKHKASSKKMADGGMAEDDSEDFPAVSESQSPSGQPGGEMAVAPMPAAPSPDMANANPGMIQDIKGAFGEKRQGAEQEALAAEQQGKEQAGIYTNAAQDLQNQNRQGMGDNADLIDQQKKFMEDYANGHVDPNRFMNSQSTGQRILNAISLVGAGIGAGITHTSNPVSDYINSQIDNDIKAQQADIGKKQNLMSANMQLMGNVRDAQALTKANMLDVASLNTKAAAAKAATPAAKAALLKQAGDLDLQKAQILGPLQMKQNAMKNAQAMNDPSVLVPLYVPKEHQKAAFDEVKTSKYVADNQQKWLDLWDKAAAEQTAMKTGFGMARESPSRAALKAQMLPVFHKMFGRITPTEVDTASKGLFPKAGDFGNANEKGSTQETERNEFVNFLGSAQQNPITDSFMKPYGVDLSKFSGTKAKPNYAPGTVINIKGKGKAQVNPDGKTYSFIK